MELNDQTIAFIGGGKMAHAMISGLIRQGHDPKKIWVTARTPTRLAQYQNEFGIHPSTNNAEAVRASTVVVLCVKPYQASVVCREIHTALQKNVLVISVITGVPMALYEKWLGAGQPIVRCMPNTPSQIGCGVTGIYVNAWVDLNYQPLIDALMTTMGSSYYFSRETDLDTVTAVTGSAPAYVLLMMEALEAAGIAAGLDPRKTARMVQEMVLGTAKMALESTHSMAELRANITSKGGTTEQALLALQEGGFYESLLQAVQRARARAQEIAKEFAAD